MLVLLGEVVEVKVGMLMWASVALGVTVLVVEVVQVLVTDDVIVLELAITTLQHVGSDLESALLLFSLLRYHANANSGNGKNIGNLGPYSFDLGCDSDEEVQEDESDEEGSNGLCLLRSLSQLVRGVNLREL